jgi:predicted transposase YbfD/YdcC
MKVSHARATAVTSTDETAGQAGGEVPGLLEVLALVPDTRKRRGRRFALVFILAVAVACVLAQAKSFREIGDHAADLPQEVLARLGGTPHPLLRRIVAPSEKRIRTLIQELDAEELDEIIGGWLRGLARAGRLDGLLTAIAIDGKWLRGVGDGQFKLFAAMLHEEKMIIAQHRIPDETTETTQVKELLEPVGLQHAVVTADAAHAQRETAEYIAGPEEDGGRNADYFLFIKGNQPGVQRAVFDLIQDTGRRAPDHVEIDYGHGRIIKRSLWVTDAGDLDFPQVTRIARIRRDRYDITGALISKEIVHAVTSLGADQASAADLAALARGQWGIESVHWLRDTAWTEDANTGYAGNGPQVMATFRNIAVSLLYHAGVTEITRTLQAITRDRTRMLSYLPL